MSPEPLSRKLLLAAVACAVFAGVGAPARAFDDAAAAKPAPAAKDNAAKTPPLPPAPKKATPAERADAERLAPLAKAAFWGRESTNDPRDAEAGVKFAQALRQIGQGDEAALAAQKVLLLQPNNVEALLELARAHITRNQPFYALAPLQRVQTVAPKDWRAYSLLGVAFDKLGRVDEARNAWSEALKRSPDNPTVLTNLAMSFAAAGRAGEAEPLLRKAAANPNATLQTRQNLALVLGLEGKTDEAERLIRNDVPPAQADADLAWIRAARQAPPRAETRTWSSLETPAAK